jgi:fucose 4-O-acetylase-like acetyltransferase
MTEGQKGSLPIRSFELDWLRTAAVLVLVFFHTSAIFSDGWFHIKNNETSYFFNVLSSFIYIWHMPLFFLISGAAASFSLTSRTGKQFRMERIRRLLIPLIFGVLIIIPPQSYFENLQKSHFEGSFFRFYPHFFEGIYPNGNLHWGHLWFLFYLLVFSLVASRLFPNLTTSNQNHRTSLFVKRYSEGKSIFLLAVPLILIEIALRWLFSGFQSFITDWANVFHYFLLFIFGFLIYSNSLLIDAIARNKTKALLVAIPFSIGFIVLIPISDSAFTEYKANPSLQYLLNHPETVLFYILLMVCKVVAEWSWLIAMLGYARKFLSDKRTGIKGLSRIALPFYIFHQTIVIAIGFFVVQLPLYIWIKYLIISLSAIPLIYACCELAKSNSVTRFIFGIK